MPRATAADAARTAERIIVAAVARFTADGYATASIDDIAREAGVTRGAVYHHFGSKQGLLRAALQAAHEQVAAHVVKQAQSHADPMGQLRAGCHAFIEAVTSTEMTGLLLIEAPAALGWASWREFDAAASVKELRDALTAVVANEDVEAMTQLLSGAMNEAALWLAQRPRDDEARAAISRSLDRLIAALTS